MARGRRPRQKGSLLGAVSGDPAGLRATMAEYLQWMAMTQYTEASVVGRSRSLTNFAAWCDERGLMRPADITRPILERYQRWLFLYRKPNGRPLGASTQHQRLTSLRSYFRWLVRQGQLLHNPASELVLPRLGRRLPQFILTTEEVEKVLAAPDVGTDAGIRDRAMLETLYSTGMRRKELAELSTFGIESGQGTVMIRQGKGRRDRRIPIGERAVLWVEKYLKDVRPSLVAGADAGVLFLTEAGEAFHPNRLSKIVREYVIASGVSKRGSCHLFRHTMATLMLENGADVRFVQEMLGHSSLQSTQLYTQVSIRKLKEIHLATHPGARTQKALPTEVEEDELEKEGFLSSLAAEEAEELEAE